MDYTFKDYTFKNDKNKTTNLAGGVSFIQDKWNSLTRWLLVGSMSNSFYASREEMTEGNLNILKECIQEDPDRVRNLIVESSKKGVTAHTPIFSLVPLSVGDRKSKQVFKSIFPLVIRTASHLYEFLEYVKKFRGYGHVIQKAVKDWLEQKTPEELEYQFLKYKKRYNWSGRDVLRKIKPTTSNLLKNSIYAWMTRKNSLVPSYLSRISAFEYLKNSKGLSQDEIVSLIRESNLTHEMIPGNIQKTPEIWNAIYQNMPIQATIRNIRNLLNQGIFKNRENIEILKNRLSPDSLKSSYIHPIDLVKAYIVNRGNSNPPYGEEISKILESAIDSSFNCIEPTGLKFFIALDVSGSMKSKPDGIMTFISIGGILSLTLIKSEKDCFVGGFSDFFTPLNISKETSFIDVIELDSDVWSNCDFGGTDASSAYMYAIRNKIYTDVFVFFTDSQNWMGDEPHKLLKTYRNMINKNVKAIYVTLAPYHDRTTLADPDDPLSYEVVGYTSQTTKLIQLLAKGV